MSKSNLPDGIHPMEKEHIIPVAQMMTRVFMQNNPIWSKFNMKKEELESFWEGFIIDHLESEKKAKSYMSPNARLNFIYVYQGLIVATILHYQIEEYRQKIKIKKEATLPVFKAMEKYGRELIKDINLDKYEKGKFVYASTGATDFEAKKPISAAGFMFEFMKIIHEAGIQGLLARTSNIKTNKAYEYIGGKILKELQFQDNGISERISLAEVDFSNQKFQNLCKDHGKVQQIKPKL